MTKSLKPRAIARNYDLKKGSSTSTADQIADFKNGKEIKSAYQSKLDSGSATLGGTLAVSANFTADKTYDGVPLLHTFKQEPNFTKGKPDRFQIELELTNDKGAKEIVRYKIRQSFWDDIDQMTNDSVISMTCRIAEIGGREVRFVEY